MKDITYLRMRDEAIRLLNSENNTMKKIRLGEAEFEKYSKDYIINWTLKRLNTNHENAWEDFDIFSEDVKIKANKLEEWIMKEYKTPEFLRAYNKEYYHTVRKFKDGRMGNIKIALKNKESAERKTAKNLQKMKVAIGACQYSKTKVTIAKLMQITGLGKTTVVKYKKILMPKN